MSGWTKVRKQSTRRASPQMTIYADGNGYLNVAADEEILDEAPAVIFHVDHEGKRLGIEPTDETRDGDAYALTRTDRAGADVRLKNALRNLGVNIDAIGETHFLPLHEEDGLAVADVSGLPFETAESASKQTEPRDETDTDDRDSDATTTVSDESDGDNASDSDEEIDVDAIAEDIKQQTTDDEAASSDDDEDKNADDPLSLKSRLADFFGERLAPGTSLETSCGEIADELEGVDGRAIPRPLKDLDDYDVEKTDKTTDTQASIWRVERVGASDDDTQEAGDVSAPEEGTQPDDSREEESESARYWCGYCGRGPFGHRTDVDEHHDRADHHGEPVPRNQDPDDENLLENGGPDQVDGRTEYQQVKHYLLEACRDDNRYYQTEDIAIGCDLSGNRTNELIEQLQDQCNLLDIERDRNMWDVQLARPDGLTEGDVHAVADEADSIDDVAESMEVDETRARGVLKAHDRLNEFVETDGGRPVCPVCEVKSDLPWKCSECGKPFDGDESSGGDRAVLGGGA